MKIALIQDWLNGFAGGEQVLLALHELYPEAPIYTSVYNKRTTPQFDKATVIPSYLQAIPYFRSHHQLAVPLMPLAFESFNLKGYDVIISVGGGLSKGVITQPDQRHISYCNTPMRYLWNIGGDTRGQGILRSQVSHKLRLWDVVSAERVDHFVANSQTVAERINKIYRMPAQVIYPPVNTDKFETSKRNPGNYFLSVGRLIQYKRIDLIVDACITTKSALKIVGTGPEEVSLRKRAANAPWIEFCGRVSDEHLQALYAEAKAFMFAAEEDFGIVPVEAMSAGCPVIAYGKGGATETVKNNITGIFFNEQTSTSLANSIKQFDQHTFDTELISNHAEQFDKVVFQKHIQTLVGE